MPLEEKRKTDRRNLRVAIICWGNSEKRDGKGIELYSKDISSEGISFYSAEIYPIGSMLLVDILLPTHPKPLSCRIKIAFIKATHNKDEYLIGAIFTDLAIDDRVSIVSVIDKMNLFVYLDKMVEDEVSDLHLTVGRPPLVRIKGRLVPLNDEVIQPGEVEAMLYPLLNNEQIKFFQTNKELDFAFSPKVTSRFRVNMHLQKGFVEAALRTISTQVKSFEELRLPVETVVNFCTRKSGLILIAGTTGSGKTTTMSSMIDYMNKRQERVIVTVEDPIEYVFVSNKSIIKQRELGRDTNSYGQALKHVLRQDPDVICVAELLDADCVTAALRAAETGHLVISTVHGSSAVTAIERIIDFFPPEHAAATKQKLASILIGIIYQTLLPSQVGDRVLATELIINNDAMKHLIRKGNFEQMANIVQTGTSHGMHTLKSSLIQLYENGLIDDFVYQSNIVGD